MPSAEVARPLGARAVTNSTDATVKKATVTPCRGSTSRISQGRSTGMRLYATARAQYATAASLEFILPFGGRGPMIRRSRR